MDPAWNLGAEHPDLGTGQVCAQCNEALEMLEEVVLLQIVYPANPHGVLQFFVAEDAQGEYLYSPYFFHVDCWRDEIELQLDEMKEDGSPDFDPEGIAECDGCTSDILPWELSGLITTGEFQRAARNPEGEAATFVPYETKSFPYCLSCLALINENCLEMWEGGITHMNVCEEGVHARCWRGECCNNPGRDGCRFFVDVKE